MEAQTKVRITKPGPLHNLEGTFISEINVRYHGGLVRIQKKKDGPISYELVPLDYLTSIKD